MAAHISSSGSLPESLSQTLHEPLLPPLGAVISGLLFYRALGYELSLALLLATTFFLLFLLNRILRFRWAAFLSGNLVLFWLAVASSAWHYDRPKPFIDASPRKWSIWRDVSTLCRNGNRTA